MSLRKRAVTAAIVLAAGAVAAIAPGPASASVSVSQGFVSGSGTIADDWADEGPLSSSSHYRRGLAGRS